MKTLRQYLAAAKVQPLLPTGQAHSADIVTPDRGGDLRTSIRITSYIAIDPEEIARTLLESPLTPSRSSARVAAYELIDGERNYQDVKWPEHKHEVEGYLVYIGEYLRRAQAACTNGDMRDAMENVRKIASLGVACMEEHPTPERLQK